MPARDNLSEFDHRYLDKRLFGNDFHKQNRRNHPTSRPTNFRQRPVALVERKYDEVAAFLISDGEIPAAGADIEIARGASAAGREVWRAEQAVFVDLESGYVVVSAIGREEKAAVWMEFYGGG